MEEEGFVIERQSKRYGPNVRIVLTDRLEVELAPNNPLGLVFDATSSQKLASVEPTRRNANHIGWLLAQVFEMMSDGQVTHRKESEAKTGPASVDDQGNVRVLPHRSGCLCPDCHPDAREKTYHHFDSM